MANVRALGIMTLAIAVLGLLVLVASQEPAQATHSCAATGSPLGPFDLQAYEALNWRSVYDNTFDLAGRNQLLSDKPSFALPQLETGGRAAGSGSLTVGYIPPTLLKAIAWIESGWTMATYSVPYGGVGPPILSHSCAYGIMQIVSGMQNFTGVASLDQAMIGSHYAFNIARGAQILADKWNAAPEYRPLVGSRDPTKVENWYYAVWSYHGFAFTNHPKNSAYPSSRSPYLCDGTQPRSNYPYQELVFGCMKNPPVVAGQRLWDPVSVTLPSSSNGAFSIANWNACSSTFNCSAMDIGTPSPSHADSASTSLTRGQVIGAPGLSLSASQVSLLAVPPAYSESKSVVISNTGTGVLAWRAVASASWLKASRGQGVSIGSQTSIVALSAESGGLSPGKYTATLTIQSLLASGAPASVTVTLYNYPDGTLLKGSGSAIYAMQRGLKRHVPNAHSLEAYGFQWGNVNRVTNSKLGTVPTGEPLLDALADGNLLKGSGSGIYVMEGGMRRHVKSLSVMAACGYGSDAVYEISDSLLVGLPGGVALMGPPCPHLSPRDGALVKGSGGAIYAMQRGLRRHVPNAHSLEAYGYEWGNVNAVSDSSLSGIPTGEPLLDALADGNLLKGSGSGVYVMEGGKRRHVVSTEVMAACGYGSDAVYVIADGLLGAIPGGVALTGPPCPHLSPGDGALVKGSGSTIYVMQRGLRRPVPNAHSLEAYGYKWGNINKVPDSALGGIPTGEPLLNALADGNLLKGSGSGIYVMEGGKRRHVISPGVMAACGYGSDAVYVIADSLLVGLPSGVALSGPPCPDLSPADGTLIKGSGSSVYVMDAGGKKLIASTGVFVGCEYQAANINPVPESSLANLPNGLALTGPPCP